MLYGLLSRELKSNTIAYINFESDEARAFINALETVWLLGHNTLSLPYWSDKIGAKNLTNLTFGLAQEGWISTVVLAKFASISLVESKLAEYIMDVDAYRVRHKFDRYKLRLDTEDKPSNLTRTPNGTMVTGLDRPGFAECAKMKFSFDTQYISKYYDTVKRNLVKSMAKMAKRYPDILDDKANYQAVSEEILDYHMCSPESVFNMEGNISDQRGRAIYEALKRVFNFISSKDARAMLVADKSVYVAYDSTKELNDIYLFIAELNGTNAKTWTGKATAGRNFYRARTLPTMTDKHLHEIIWLERIYDALDTVFTDGHIMWSIPLELDATASIAQIIGVLTNDKRLLAKTNVIESSDLQDFWSIEGVSNRNAIKSVGTPVGYGSSQSFNKLLKAKGETLTAKEMRALKKEFNSGAFSVIKRFKDLMIDYMDIKTPTYEVNNGYEVFTTTVNKHKAVGASKKAYTAYCTETGKFKVVYNNSVITVPDYDRFKLYSATGIVHNLDSLIMDNTMVTLHKRGEWAVAIHDAGLVLPGTYMRTAYINELETLRANRDVVLNSYRKSIGCVGNAADIAFAKLMNSTEQLDSTIPFELSALK